MSSVLGPINHQYVSIRSSAIVLTVVSSMYGMGMFIPGTEVSFPEPPEVKPKQRTCRKGNARIDGAIRDRRQNMAKLNVS